MCVCVWGGGGGGGGDTNDSGVRVLADRYRLRLRVYFTKYHKGGK